MRADGSTDQKEWEPCLAHIPTHCDIAEGVTGQDELNPRFEGYWDPAGDTDSPALASAKQNIRMRNTKTSSVGYSPWLSERKELTFPVLKP
jgi:hypothetical protein